VEAFPGSEIVIVVGDLVVVIELEGPELAELP
jgi:hypothetical protein